MAKCGVSCRFYVTVWKTGFYSLSRLSDAGVGGCSTPRTSCLRHSYGVIVFRGIKPLNPCSARLSYYRQKNFTHKNMFLMFLCLKPHTQRIYTSYISCLNKLSLCLSSGRNKIACPTCVLCTSFYLEMVTTRMVTFSPHVFYARKI